MLALIKDLWVQKQQIRCPSFPTPPGDPHRPRGVWRTRSSWAAVLCGDCQREKCLPQLSPTVLRELAKSLRLAFFSPQLDQTNHWGFSCCHRIIINQQTQAKYMTLEFTCKENCEIFKRFSFRSDHFKNNSWWMFKLSPIFAHLAWQKQDCFWNAW